MVPLFGMLHIVYNEQHFWHGTIPVKSNDMKITFKDFGRSIALYTVHDRAIIPENFTNCHILNDEIVLTYKAPCFHGFCKFSAELTCQFSMVYDWNRSQMARCVLDTDKAG